MQSIISFHNVLPASAALFSGQPAVKCGQISSHSLALLIRHVSPALLLLTTGPLVVTCGLPLASRRSPLEVTHSLTWTLIFPKNSPRPEPYGRWEIALSLVNNSCRKDVYLAIFIMTSCILIPN